MHKLCQEYIKIPRTGCGQEKLSIFLILVHTHVNSKEISSKLLLPFIGVGVMFNYKLIACFGYY